MIVMKAPGEEHGAYCVGPGNGQGAVVFRDTEHVCGKTDCSLDCLLLYMTQPRQGWAAVRV